MLIHGDCLTGRASAARAGFTLAELTLVLALSGLVLGLIASVGTRLQRQLSAEATRLDVGEQLAAAAELLPLELRSLSPLGGDISEARDSVMQFRSSLGSGVECGTSGSSIVVAPFLAASGRAAVFAAQGGDTLWLWQATDTTEQWLPLRLLAARRVSASCALLDASSARVFDIAHLWSLDLSAPIAATPGAVLRLTRPVRYSFYRASDGHWYLGMKSWNAATSQFNTIQPVSGLYAPGAAGARFEYFDEGGTTLPLGADPTRIARVEVVLRGAPSAAGGQATIDSLRTVIALRNRR
jgi:hypothetical protein